MVLLGRWDIIVTAFSALLLVLLGGIMSVAHAPVGR
jgi:lipid-binding SYLF domain-containing protein